MPGPDIDKELPIILEAARDNKLTPEEAMFLVGMRIAENGPPGFEFGVKMLKGTNLRRQAGGAAGSIIKNRDRYDKFVRAGGKPNYTDFFAYHGGPVGNGWAPIIGVPKSEAELNGNWRKNVDDAIGRLLPKTMPKIKDWYDDSMQKTVLGNPDGVGIVHPKKGMTIKVGEVKEAAHAPSDNKSGR